jgi:hypothetical protein
MTEQTTDPLAEQPMEPPLSVVPEEGSRLAQLHAAYPDAKAAADEAASRLKGITDAIKAELNAQAPDKSRLVLKSPHGPALALTYAESWRIDATRLKKENPLIYVTYAKKSGSWSLRAVRGGEGEE